MNLTMEEYLRLDPRVRAAIFAYYHICVSAPTHNLVELERRYGVLTREIQAAVERWEELRWPALRGWQIFMERETATGFLWVWNEGCRGFQIGLGWWRFCCHYWMEEA